MQPALASSWPMASGTAPAMHREKQIPTLFDRQWWPRRFDSTGFGDIGCGKWYPRRDLADISPPHVRLSNPSWHVQ
eukprot:4690271-Pyramimonas_sp.AAC.1